MGWSSAGCFLWEAEQPRWVRDQVWDEVPKTLEVGTVLMNFPALKHPCLLEISVLLWPLGFSSLPAGRGARIPADSHEGVVLQLQPQQNTLLAQLHRMIMDLRISWLQPNCWDTRPSLPSLANSYQHFVVLEGLSAWIPLPAPLHHHTKVVLILKLVIPERCCTDSGVQPGLVHQPSHKPIHKSNRKDYPNTSLLLCSGTSCSLENQKHEFALTLKAQWSKVAVFHHYQAMQTHSQAGETKFPPINSHRFH